MTENPSKEEIIDVISKELERSFSLEPKGMERNAGCVPVWMNVLYILKRYNNGNTRGVFSIKIAGTDCFGFRIVDEKVDLHSDLFGTLNFPKESKK